MKKSVVMTTNAREGQLIMLPAGRPDTFSGNNYPKILGPWLVIEAKMAGGSGWGRDPYPDGWQVTVQRRNKNNQPMPKTEFTFYQSGCFNVIIPEVQVIGKMTKKVTTVWT